MSSFTAILHAMVKKAPSGLAVRDIADYVGKPYSTLISELSRQEGHKLGADLILPLMDACESDAPLVFLARERGGVFVRLPDAATSPVAMLTTAALDSVREFGEFAAEVATDIADGDIPNDQLARIRKEGSEAIAAIAALLRIAEQVNTTQKDHTRMGMEGRPCAKENTRRGGKPS